jgi:tRNA pseudouridine38-40 synthase
VRGLSALCAPHIAVTRVDIAPDDFNARFDTKGKHYLYTILNRSARSPLYGPRSWHVPARLDPDRMRAAAARFVGTFDFAGFRAADCGRINTVRTITGVDIRFPGGDLIEIHVTGTAFLKHMVRIMAGTLVDIGRGVLPPDAVEQVLASRDRRQAGRTAPARGLTLVAVFY